MAPLVSVVVPVYNGAKYVRAALDSALGQTYPAVEVVAVDDGSTDESAAVLASYGSRLVVVRQPNAGVAAARNAGIQASRGELIAFLDQDDWWLPEKIERQVACFQAEPQVGLIHTGVLQYSERAATFVDPVYPIDDTSQLQGHCHDLLLLGNGIFNSSVMIRRGVLEVAGRFDPSLGGNSCQDYDLWLRIARRYPLGYVAEDLTVLRLHDEQGTWNRRTMLRDELGVLERAAGPDGLRASSVLRAHFALRLDELGVAHLDAGEPRLARPCFRRAMRMRWSVRAALLYAACILPPSGIEWLRRQRARWRRRDTSTTRDRPAALVRPDAIPSSSANCSTSA